jgi:hypothetical protein
VAGHHETDVYLIEGIDGGGRGGDMVRCHFEL